MEKKYLRNLIRGYINTLHEQNNLNKTSKDDEEDQEDPISIDKDTSLIVDMNIVKFGIVVFIPLTVQIQ